MNGKFITIDNSGRIVIPALYRKELGTKDGEEIFIYFKDNEVRIMDKKMAEEKNMAEVEKIREKWKKLKKPGESVVEGFLKNRKKYSGDI